MGQMIYADGKQIGFICKKCLKIVGFTSPTTGLCYECYRGEWESQAKKDMESIMFLQRRKAWHRMFIMPHMDV